MKTILSSLLLYFAPLLFCVYAMGQDTIITKQIINDTIPFSNESDSLFVHSPDSLAEINPFLTSFKDSTSAAQPKKKQFIESEVTATAKDSSFVSVNGQKMFLFGEAKLLYDDFELTAAYVEIDFHRKTIYAEGVPDSTGTIVGQPVFVQGDETMKAKTITYNVETRKGFIKGLYSEQDEGFLQSESTKKEFDNSINMQNGKFTTCELEDPHFYMKITMGKVIPDKAIVAGYSYMVMGGVPLPVLGVPFGYFPNSKNATSGFLIPSYGNERTRGYYLKDGGYYFVLGDYADLAVQGDVYSLGSWRLGAVSGYRLRYKFSGRLDLGYSKNIVGEPGTSTYKKSNDYRIVWSHSQDPKARPNSTFSANVNFRSSGDNKFNSTNFDDYLQSSISSSISYSKTFANTPFSMNASFRHTLNTKDSSVSVLLPDMNVKMRTVFPLKRKKVVGKERFYEKIGLSYSGSFKNSFNVKEDQIFKPEVFDVMQNGVQHSLPITTSSFKLLKYLNISPNLSYSENWYFKRNEWQKHDVLNSEGKLINDSIISVEEKGFYRAYNYNYGASVNTKVYGMFTFPWSKRIKAIRHVVTPSVSFRYQPDMEKANYPRDIRNDSMLVYFNPYQGSVYSSIVGRESGSVNFALGNNLEMKVANPNDSLAEPSKIKILESFNLSTGYDMMKDSMNWSPISISARTKLFNMFDINFNATADPYAINDKGQRYNKAEFKETGNLVRITDARASTGITINSKNLGGKKEENGADNKTETELTPEEEIQYQNNLAMGMPSYFYQYDYFDVPWDIRINYSISYTKKTRAAYQITQSMDFSGNFSLTPNWKIGFRSGYDFKDKELSATSFNLSRDLHCWMASLNLIPFGPRQSFNFTIGVKASILQDLKYNKRKSWIENQY